MSINNILQNVTQSVVLNTSNVEDLNRVIESQLVDALPIFTPDFLQSTTIPNKIYKIHYIISRYDFDKNPPENRIVGFTITRDETIKKEYIEALIPISDCETKTDPEICDMAFNKIKDRIKILVEKLNNFPVVIGKEYIPSITV